MPDTTKRVRSSKTRDKRWLQFMRTITAEWARTVREQRPHADTFKALSDRIHALDILPTYKADLSTRNWGARDLVEALHAEWCLYLDGKRLASSSECPPDRFDDLRGRFEWRGTGKPFYDNAEPAPLGASKGANDES
jgi:hypothetical protein